LKREKKCLKHVSDETRSVMSLAHIGTHLSAETKEKLSLKMKGIGIGRVLSLETREKQSIAQKKRWEKRHLESCLEPDQY
jgi:hypothetical protein